jgi:hypothetical protein
LGEIVAMGGDDVDDVRLRRTCRLENLHHNGCGLATCAGLEACTTTRVRVGERAPQDIRLRRITAGGGCAT